MIIHVHQPKLSLKVYFKPKAAVPIRLNFTDNMTIKEQWKLAQVYNKGRRLIFSR